MRTPERLPPGACRRFPAARRLERPRNVGSIPAESDSCEGCSPRWCSWELQPQYRKDPERRLSAAETARALEILAATRARVEVLRSRALRAKVEASDALRERGEFVDHAPGEPYHREPGVVTHGEDLGDAGMRIFYLFPEQFPEIYDFEAEKRRAPARGIREVLAIINRPAGVSGG